MTREEELLKKRLIELSNNAYYRESPVFTDFLNLNEQNIFHTIQNELAPVKTICFGGYESAERQMVAFLPDAFLMKFDNSNYPMEIVCIEPANAKFADTLSHRDFLGAILNLGIERCKIGDIIIEENKAYIFCSNKLSQFLIDELRKVKHTIIRTRISDLKDFKYEPQLKVLKGSVASVRIDGVLTVCANCSRGDAVDLINAKKVFVNGRLVEANSYNLKNEDVISVRGLGKFIFSGIISETKKGRYYIEIKKYI